MKIFISYRRDDTAYQAHRICELLGEQFGGQSVFIDLDSIPPGVDFRQHIHDSVGSCTVLLAVIGEKWLTTARDGERRLDDPRDFVRIEIEAALQRGIPVVPVLIGATDVPRPEELPQSLADLAYRHAVKIRPARDFSRDVEDLIRGLNLHKTIGNTPERGKSGDPICSDFETPPPGSDDERSFGIDLGMANSMMAMRLGREAPTICRMADGSELKPSIVYIQQNGTPLVGRWARPKLVVDPVRTISCVKRFMGNAEKTWAIDDVSYSAVDVSSIIIRELLSDFSKHFPNQTPITKAAISVPADFDEKATADTIEAAKQAGLEEVGIILEPVASALYYMLSEHGRWLARKSTEATLLVTDLGGATFDLALVRYFRNKATVIAHDGDRELGGIDWTNVLFNWLVKSVTESCGFNPIADFDSDHHQRVAASIHEAAEEVKCQLSDQPEAYAMVANLAPKEYSGSNVHLDCEISRAMFEQVGQDLVARMMVVIERLLNSSGQATVDIDKVLCVGGASRMPMIQNALRTRFGDRVDTTIPPKHCVAFGTAYFASAIRNTSGNRVIKRASR